MYGLIATIFCLVQGKSVSGVFAGYLFWSTVLFLPISIICALYTKYVDSGEGLTFESDNVVVIMFAHIAEEILGLVLSPIWLIMDIVKKDWNFWKVVDYILYFILLVYIFVEIIF